MRAFAEIDLHAKLEENLKFERLVAVLSSHFINVPADRVYRFIEDAQRRICEFLDVDHSTVWQAAGDYTWAFVPTHFYRSPELTSQGPADVAATTPPTTADAIRPPSCSVKNHSQTQQGPTLQQEGGIYEGEICGSCGFGVRAS